MRKIFLKTIGGMALAVLLMAMVAPIWVSGQNGGGRLEGTWDVQVTIRNCQTGAAIRTFASIGTFMSGGTMLDSTSGIPHALNVGHGVWSHESGNTYRFKFKSFNFDAGGNFTGWGIINHEANLNSKA